LVGAIVGLSLGWLVEVQFTFAQKAFMKTIGGFFITFFFGTRLIIPALRQGEPAASTSKMTAAYFAFYLSLFVATLPSDWSDEGRVGRQTLVGEGEDMKCETSWWGGEFA